MKLGYNIIVKILIFVQLFLIFSCRTNKVPKNGHLFIDNKYKYVDKKGKPYLDAYGNPFLNKKGKEIINEYKKPFEDELDSYVKQKSNKKILFIIPLGLWLYDFSNPTFDSVYAEYYSVSQKQRNQKLLDSLYVKYNLKNYVGKSRWFDRFFYNNGEAPVLVDTLLSKTSSKNIQQYFKNRGWRKSIVRDSVITSGKKAHVQYSIKLGRPMIMDTITYDIADEIKDDLYAHYLKRTRQAKKKKSQTYELSKDEFIYNLFSRGSYVKKGDRLDAYVIENEISRLENRFKNMGYYRFNDLKDEVIYYVDTANNVYDVSVRLSIKKSQIGSSTTTTAVTDSTRSDTLKKDTLVHKFKRFKYNKINISLLDNENRDTSKNTIDSSFYVTTKKIVRRVDGRKTKMMVNDTIAFIVNHLGNKYKNRVLADMLAIEKGHSYNLSSETRTRRNIYKVNNFNILGFNTVPEKDSDSTLISNIILSPMDKYSYELGFEAFNSGVVNFGITPNLTFTVKNLFGGAENLSVSFGGSLGNIKTKKNNSKIFNASELSAQASLSFPKLILPFNAKRLIPKAWGPSSAISLGYNAQYNIGLDKRSYNAGLLYNFNPTRTTVHQITLWNLQYTQFLNPNNYFNIYTQDSKVRNSVYDLYFQQYPSAKEEYDKNHNDNDLLFQIQNNIDFQDYLRSTHLSLANDYDLMEFRRYRFTQNVLISSFKYDFTYDQRLGYFPGKHPFYLKAQVELAGNLESLFNKTLKDFTTSNNKTIKQIFGVPYSQYVKFDLDLRKFWIFSGKKSFNARLFTGIGIPYGNSFSMPFDRSYSVGGPSDVRAWKSFGFGPGSSKLGGKDGYELIAIDNFKLLTQVEYRFPLPSKGFEGALFVDAGNVWGINNNSLNKFEFNSFYKELGIGGGWGIRWDISNFIIRFDFAYRFHDPRRDENDRWYFKYINLLKPQVNFAIDYPF